MAAVIPTIELILEALGAAASSGLLGSKVASLAPMLSNLADLATVPTEFESERAALLAQVQGWVAAGVEPTDAELDAFAASRTDIATRAAAARAALD